MDRTQRVDVLIGGGSVTTETGRRAFRRGAIWGAVSTACGIGAGLLLVMCLARAGGLA
jgi:hypothetical protein